MSVTWRFIQPLLKRFSRTPDPGTNLYRITFSSNFDYSSFLEKSSSNPQVEALVTSWWPRMLTTQAANCGQTAHFTCLNVLEISYTTAVLYTDETLADRTREDGIRHHIGKNQYREVGNAK
jgi:hypothetical protein